MISWLHTGDIHPGRGISVDRKMPQAAVELQRPERFRSETGQRILELFFGQGDTFEKPHGDPTRILAGSDPAPSAFPQIVGTKLWVTMVLPLVASAARRRAGLIAKQQVQKRSMGSGPAPEWEGIDKVVRGVFPGDHQRKSVSFCFSFNPGFQIPHIMFLLPPFF